MAHFARYVGIDYSGAEAPYSTLEGFRVYLAEGTGPANEVLPPPSPRKFRTRREVAEWLATVLSEGTTEQYLSHPSKSAPDAWDGVGTSLPRVQHAGTGSCNGLQSLGRPGNACNSRRTVRNYSIRGVGHELPFHLPPLPCSG